MRWAKKSIQPRISYFMAMSSTTKQHLQFISPELKIPYILWIEFSSWTLFFSVLTNIFGLCWHHLKYIDKVPAITFPSPEKALSMCSSFYIDCYGTFWSLNGHRGILKFWWPGNLSLPVNYEDSLHGICFHSWYAQFNGKGPFSDKNNFWIWFAQIWNFLIWNQCQGFFSIKWFPCPQKTINWREYIHHNFSTRWSGWQWG